MLFSNGQDAAFTPPKTLLVCLQVTQMGFCVGEESLINTVAASLTDGENCGVLSSAGQVEEELGLQVKNWPFKGREQAGCLC